MGSSTATAKNIRDRLKKAKKTKPIVQKPKPKPAIQKPKMKLKDMTPEQNKALYDSRRRKPLSKLEQDFLKDFYYKGEGSYAGRDVMYNAMKAHYAKHKTPKNQQISRRRMWEYFLSKQESNQLHRAAPKNSEVIRPINSKYKLEKLMADLIIRGGDSARKYHGILCVVDVATRKAWTELLVKGTNAKIVAKAMEKVLQRMQDELVDSLWAHLLVYFRDPIWDVNTAFDAIASTF